jgi:hypothetical protein
MDLQEALTMVITALITVVLAHLAVFWVVKTLYPPPPKVIQVPVPMPMAPAAPVAVAVAAPAAPTYTPPPVTEQHVELPTYTTPASVEAPREERKGPPPPEDTSIRRKPGVDGA